MPAARIFLQLIADFVVYLGLLIRPRKAIAAENLFLRRQLAGRSKLAEARHLLSALNATPHDGVLKAEAAQEIQVVASIQHWKQRARLNAVRGSLLAAPRSPFSRKERSPVTRSRRT